MKNKRLSALAIAGAAAVTVTLTACGPTEISPAASGQGLASAPVSQQTADPAEGVRTLTHQRTEAEYAAIVAKAESIPVKGRSAKTGYDRKVFGEPWSDNNTVEFGQNGCDTRNDILARDLDQITYRTMVYRSGNKSISKCIIESGVLADPYTGKTIEFQRGTDTSAKVQIDHVVSLSNAWQTGASNWPKYNELRRYNEKFPNFANDPRNLYAVDGPTNQAKGDGDAATWLPPNKDFRCDYVASQTEVKYEYGLWFTPAERTAILRELGNCPGQN